MNKNNIKKLYEEVEELRRQLKASEKAKNIYNQLKRINKNDQLYSWMFDDDAILTDDLDALSLYKDNYIIDVLTTYKQDLKYIIERGLKA
jgi:hypothetical protein